MQDRIDMSLKPAARHVCLVLAERYVRACVRALFNPLALVTTSVLACLLSIPSPHAGF